MKLKVGEFKLCEDCQCSTTIANIFENDQFELFGMVYHSDFDNGAYLPSIGINFKLPYRGSFQDRTNAEKHVKKLLKDFLDTITDLNKGQEDLGQMLLPGIGVSA